METTKSRTELTSADTKQLGFEYQYLFFFLKLFGLKRGSEVGYEVLDDVHIIDTNERKIYLYQLKHTTQTNAEGGAANLTTFSIDFWKTLSNWSKVIVDPVEGRKETTEQEKFLQNVNFIFVSNRDSKDNLVICKMNEVKNGSCNVKGFIKYLKSLKKESNNIKIKAYIDDVLSLKDTVLKLFIENIVVEDSNENIHESLRNEIRDMMISDEYVEEVLANVYWKLKKDFFDRARRGIHQVISHDEWLSEYSIFFNKVRTTLLPIRKFKPVLPEHLDEQTFVKELIQIGAIPQNDIAEMAELTTQLLTLELQLQDWNETSKVTEDDIKEFHSEAIQIWHRIHTKNHRSTQIDVKLDYQNAINCYDEVMSKELYMLQTRLNSKLSNGEFLGLANKKRIGWLEEWKERYRVSEK